MLQRGNPDKRCDCSMYLKGAGGGVVMHACKKEEMKIELKARPKVRNDGLDGSFHASRFSSYIHPAIFSTATLDTVSARIIPCPYWHRAD